MSTWRPIPGWGDRYEVSDRGQVRTVPGPRPGRHPETRRHILATSGGNRWEPYLTVDLWRERHHRRFRVHQLVARAFLGPRPPGHMVCHRNGDYLDNRAVNLTYGTPARNNLDSVRHGTHRYSRRTHCKNGHRLAGRNIRRIPNRHGGTWRLCVPCRRAISARQWQKTRSAGKAASGHHRANNP